MNTVDASRVGQGPASATPGVGRRRARVPPPVLHGAAAGHADHEVKTLAKALSVLEAVVAFQHPPTVGELAAALGLSRPTTHRLVQTLLATGFLMQQPGDQRLVVGYAVLPLASSLLDRNRLRLEAMPHLQALAQKMNERVNLGILFRQRVLLLGGIEKPSLPTIYSRFGRTVPLYCCGLGKAILAYLPPARAKAMLEAEPMTERGPETITSVPAMLRELEAIRARGYATERGENSPTSCCVAVPILDGEDLPVGALSVSGRSLDTLVTGIDAVLGTAELISHRL